MHLPKRSSWKRPGRAAGSPAPAPALAVSLPMMGFLGVGRPQRPAGSTHSSTRSLRPPEQLERPAGFPSSDKTRPDSPVPTLQGPCGRSWITLTVPSCHGHASSGYLRSSLVPCLSWESQPHPGLVLALPSAAEAGLTSSLSSPGSAFLPWRLEKPSKIK